MLYERWRQIAHSQANEFALWDLADGRRWTFAEMASVVDTTSRHRDSAIAFPQGNSAEFIFAVLRAWRSGQVVCPLEPGQPVPRFKQKPPVKFAHLKTTSATGGEPRLVAFTADQLAADAESIVAMMGLRVDWPNLAVISLAHSYGFSNLITPLLLYGIPLLLAGSSLPEVVRRTAGNVKSVTLAAVPALWRMWTEAGAVPSNAKLAISAGAPLPLTVEQSVFSNCGLKIHNFYGSSECGGIAYDTSLEPRSDASIAGAPMCKVSLSVSNDACLQVRGRAVAETYWPEPSSSLAGGIFQTTDLAEIKDGLVFLLGRAGDQINIAGRKVSPESVEEVLLSHPQVRDCLVLGVPSADAGRGEEILACVVCDSIVRSETLKQFVLARLPAWQVPREWRFVDSLDTNQRGKQSRAEWRRQFLSPTFRQQG